jgi:hypothetical protein
LESKFRPFQEFGSANSNSSSNAKFEDKEEPEKELEKELRKKNQVPISHHPILYSKWK